MPLTYISQLKLRIFLSSTFWVGKVKLHLVSNIAPLRWESIPASLSTYSPLWGESSFIHVQEEPCKFIHANVYLQGETKNTALLQMADTHAKKGTGRVFPEKQSIFKGLKSCCYGLLTPESKHTIYIHLYTSFLYKRWYTERKIQYKITITQLGSHSHFVDIWNGNELRMNRTSLWLKWGWSEKIVIRPIMVLMASVSRSIWSPRLMDELGWVVRGVIHKNVRGRGGIRKSYGHSKSPLYLEGKATLLAPGWDRTEFVPFSPTFQQHLL